jgi:splicing factor 3A subunit 1
MHDFGVIATVLFDEADDAAELPAPESLANLQSASLEQKAAISLNTKRIDEAMPDDVTYYNASQQHAIPTPSYSAMPPPGQASYAPMPSAPADYRTDAQRRQEEEARAAQAERDRAAQAQAAARGAPGSMKIRTDYVPKGKKANVPMNMCPNCKQSFPADEIAEHIRIELLDPSWKEQREKTQARYSTVINPSEAANNLKRFASQREDIYDGVTGMPISEEEVARRKKAATSYDGQPDPAKDAARVSQMATMNVQEQLRRIQERHGGGQ